MSEKENKQYMITVDHTGKVYEYSEVDSGFSKTEHFYPKNLEELSELLKDKNVSIPEDAKFSVSINGDNEVVVITLVGEDAPQFTQLFFNSKEEADKAIIKEDYRPSYQIMPPEIKELLNNFFSGKVCFFEGYEDLRSSFLSELDSTPQRKHASVKSIYEDKVLQKILKR